MNTGILETFFQLANQLLPALDISGCLLDNTFRVLWAGPGTSRFVKNPDISRIHSYIEIYPHLDDLEAQKLLDRAVHHGEIEKYLYNESGRSKTKTCHRYLFIPLKFNGATDDHILILHILLSAEEKKQFENRLTDRHLAGLVQSAADGVVSVDRNGLIQFWNKGAEQIFGYSADEVIGKYPGFLIPERLNKTGELEWLIEKTKEKGAIVNYETERLAKDGSIFVAEITRTALINDDGEFEGSSAIIKDVSDRKKIEQELTLAIEELSKLNELTDFLYSSRDLQEIYKLILIGVTAGEGLKYNRAFLILTDENQQYLRGHMAVGPDSVEDASKIWDSIGIKKSLAESLEVNRHGIGITDKEVNSIVQKIKYNLNDNTHILVKVFHAMMPTILKRSFSTEKKELEFFNLLGSDEIALIPLFGKNLKIGILLVDNNISRLPIRDEDLGILRLFSTQSGLAIENAMLYQKLNDQLDELKGAYTDLQRTQSRLIEAERLATLGEFTAIMAHEIRNPLVSVGGFARLLKDEMLENPERQKYIDIIINESVRLEKILTNLLDFSQSKNTMEKASNNINEILRRTFILFEEQLKRASVNLKLELDEMLPPIHINDLEIMQVFLNILQNALQAIKGKGEIKVTSYMKNDTIVVDIEDNGEGINDEIRAKIFQPFFSTKPKGTGLGLVVTKQLIHKYNGAISLQSKDEQGTMVRISLPIVNLIPKNESKAVIS